MHTQSSSDGLEATFKGVVWEPTCFKMNILMAKMRLELLRKDHIKNVKAFSELKRRLHSAGLIGMAFP